MMNLSSPLFDKVRIPPRRTPESIAIAICAEAGIAPDLVRSAAMNPRDGMTSRIRLVRCQIARAMRNQGVARASIAAWLGVSYGTVGDYLADAEDMPE